MISRLLVSVAIAIGLLVVIALTTSRFVLPDGSNFNGWVPPDNSALAPERAPIQLSVESDRSVTPVRLRGRFLAAFETLANLATRRAVEGAPIRIEAPIVRMGKAEIVRQGYELGVDFALTVSCYNADGAVRACGACDACRFRREGFERAGIADPTRYQPG